MTSAAQPTAETRSDVRTIVGGGLKLGIATAFGVAVFALQARWLGGQVEVVVQAVLILLGGALFAYAPASWVEPRNVDGIAWASLVGLLGSVVFTVVDTALLRPVHLYPWTWDAIGGGSGFWYIPVWWMGSCFVAWLGAWSYSILARSGGSVARAALQTTGLAALVFALLVVTGIAPPRGTVVALAYTVALVLHVPLAAVMRTR